MSKLNEIVQNFEQVFPGLGNTLKVVIATSMTNSIERDTPLSIVLVGPPSSGKTTVLMTLIRAQKNSMLAKSIKRLDDFSSASLVSHYAKVPEEKRSSIDLLPQMKDKIVVIKEMSTLFTGHEDEVRRTLGRLVSVLDGEGFVTNSGTMGCRGYDEKIIFTLIGAIATDALKGKTLHLMNSLGPRLLFWRIEGRATKTVFKGSTIEARQMQRVVCNEVTEFIDERLSALSSEKIELTMFEFSDSVNEQVSCLADLVSRGRAVKSPDEIDSSRTSFTVESPDRAYWHLIQFLQGSALAHGRRRIETEDLNLGLGIVLGSIQQVYARCLRAFLTSAQALGASEVESLIGVSNGTVRKYIKELVELGVLESVSDNGSKEWDLSEQFKCLRRLI